MKPGFLGIYVADFQVPCSHHAPHDTLTMQNQHFKWPVSFTCCLDQHSTSIAQSVRYQDLMVAAKENKLHSFVRLENISQNTLKLK